MQVGTSVHHGWTCEYSQPMEPCCVHAGTKLVQMAIEGMVASNADEVVLEAEVTNTGALALYANLGFVRDKRLAR